MASAPQPRNGRCADIRRHRLPECVLWKHRGSGVLVNELLVPVFKLILRLASALYPARTVLDFVNRVDTLARAALVGLGGVLLLDPRTVIGKHGLMVHALMARPRTRLDGKNPDPSLMVPASTAKST